MVDKTTNFLLNDVHERGMFDGKTLDLQVVYGLQKLMIVLKGTASTESHLYS